MMNRAEIIQKVADKIGAKTYLEIGVAHAETLLQLAIPHKIGVDPARPAPAIVQVSAQALTNKLNSSGARLCIKTVNSDDETILQVTNLEAENPGRHESLRYFQMPSDEFFQDFAKQTISETGIDIAFVDGLHEWRQVVRDVQNCLTHLNENGVILMHDCMPNRKIVATPFDELQQAKQLPEWDGTWTGDVYRAALWLRSQRPDLQICVLNTDWGVGIIRRGTPEQILNLTESQIANFAYEEFDANRVELLNLRDSEYLSEYLTLLAPVRQYRTPVSAASRTADFEFAN